MSVHVYHTLVVALVLSWLDYGNDVLVGLPAYLYNGLQSVLNAAARSIAGLRRSDQITDTLASCHWSKVPERIQFKLATIVYRSLNGTAPRYLAADLRRLSDMPSRRRLRSSLTDQLYIRQLQCSTWPCSNDDAGRHGRWTVDACSWTASHAPVDWSTCTTHETPGDRWMNVSAGNASLLELAYDDALCFPCSRTLGLG